MPMRQCNPGERDAGLRDGETGVEIVNPKRFLEATRESGYRTFDAALSELVDNSLQAGATRVEIALPDSAANPLDACVAVLDNGSGMDTAELATALQFGGSRRFNDRTGMGRFGMGLPNSSLSQARRVDVYSWREHREVWHSYLDLDDVLASGQILVPTPVLSRLPEAYRRRGDRSGTLVVWRKLDRIKHSSWRLIARRVMGQLGRKFRYFLWEGRTLSVNAFPVGAFDPLFLSSETRVGWITARPYGEPLEYRVKPPGDAAEGGTAAITVRFSELPVHQLAPLQNKDKRAYGIVNGAGVSVVRAGREIDYGWFFLNKRRENYDDWWRCEIRFNPELDEMFGVTHTKQGIRPSEDLKEILCGELTAVARVLNRRVRATHMEFGAEQARHAAESIAAAQDLFLRPVCPSADEAVPQRARPGGGSASRQGYRLVVEELDEPAFYRTEWRDGEVTVVLNSLHEFYAEIYRPLFAAAASPTPALRKHLELFLLALGRTEQLEWSPEEQGAIRRFAEEWSRAIAVFCSGTGHGTV